MRLKTQAIFTRYKDKIDDDIQEFLGKQGDKGFAIKFLIRAGIKQFGNKNLEYLKYEIDKKGVEKVLNDNV